jgi:hypothetical protein
MIVNNICISASKQQVFSGTRTALWPIERRNLSLQILAKTDPVTQLAQNYQVSRKFLYQQAAKAQRALDKMFNPPEPDKEVIYHLPITKEWLRQFALCLVLIGHSSFRAVCQILDTAFDYKICPSAQFTMPRFRKNTDCCDEPRRMPCKIAPKCVCHLSMSPRRTSARQHHTDDKNYHHFMCSEKCGLTRIFDLSQKAADLWDGSNNTLKRELLEALSSNRTVSDVNLCITKRKPFDILTERPKSSESRGDRIRTYGLLVPNQAL